MKTYKYTDVLVNGSAVYSHEISHTLNEWKEILRNQGVVVKKICPMKTWLEPRRGQSV